VPRSPTGRGIFGKGTRLHGKKLGAKMALRDRSHSG